MTCAKRVVTCTIVSASGERFIGRNDCANPQRECPRHGNDDYTKCKTICQQEGHAEVIAINLAGHQRKSRLKKQLKRLWKNN